MLNKEKRLEVINRQINKLNDNTFKYNIWLEETKNLIEKVFSNFENKKIQLREAVNQPGAAFNGLDVRELKRAWKEILEGYIYEINLELDDTTQNVIKHIESTDKKALDRQQVFIVHGHDETAKTKTARFIEKLGLKTIILHEQASGSKTVIEKIEAYSNVGFGIVLYTPCDTGAKKEDDLKLKNRARQNVVFEHGFLIGKIGRANVCALVKDDIETPNDISGVVYVKMDDDEAWQLKVAKELRNAGYDIDLNKL